MSKKIEKRQAEEKEKYSFVCDCGERSFFECVPYPGIELVRVCDKCGENNLLTVPVEGTERSIYKLRDNQRELNSAIAKVLQRLNMQIGVRSLFYQLASVEKVLPKTEKSYKVVCNYVSDMRLRGWLDWRCITDETRVYFAQTTFSGIGGAIDHISMSYRKDLWADRPSIGQIWIEKLGLAGTIRPITYKYDVALLPVRGYNSLTFLQQTAEEIKRANNEGKKFYIYHFGDYDPSGVNAAETIENSLIHLGAKNFHFERKAITRQQIIDFDLPTRPTKKSDSRSKGFIGESCELDALDPRMFRDMVEDCILNHINKNELRQLKSIEDMERQQLKELKLLL